MGRGRGRNPLSASRTDVEDLSTTVAGTAHHTRNGNGASPETSRLAGEILAQRALRLTKQNTKLDFEIAKHEEQWGNITQMRRDVRRSNAVVMQSLYALANRVAEPVASMNDPQEIRDFLHAQLREACNDLAYEQPDT
jgi:hypothetical protein